MVRNIIELVRKEIVVIDGKVTKEGVKEVLARFTLVELQEIHTGVEELILEKHGHPAIATSKASSPISEPSSQAS
jgi:hypothetical protein